MKKYLRAVILLLILTCALGCAACRDTDAEAARADFAAGAETALPQETAAEAFDPAALSLAELAEWRDDAAVVAAWKDAHPFELSYIQMQAVDSSAISKAGYGWPWQALAVQFTSQEAIYVYFGVPESTYRELVAANSAGRYYNQYIKGQYEGEKYE